MPLYDYIDSETGRKVELFRTVAERDNVPANLRRIIPHSFALLCPPDPYADAKGTQKALYQLEQQLGLPELERQTGFSRKQLKKVWFDEAEKPNPNDVAAPADATA